MLGRLVLESLVRPRSAARAVLAQQVPVAAVLQAALAIACIGVLLGTIALRIAGTAADVVSQTVLGNPLLGAAMQFGLILLIAVLAYRIGRACGGTGELGGALALVVWLNAVLVVVQVAQLVALLLVPALGSVLAIASVLWLIWAFTAFVTELHGFRHQVVVLGGVVLSMFVVFAGIAVLLAMLGLSPQEPF